MQSNISMICVLVCYTQIYLELFASQITLLRLRACGFYTSGNAFYAARIKPHTHNRTLCARAHLFNGRRADYAGERGSGERRSVCCCVRAAVSACLRCDKAAPSPHRNLHVSSRAVRARIVWSIGVGWELPTECDACAPVYGDIDWMRTRRALHWWNVRNARVRSAVRPIFGIHSSFPLECVGVPTTTTAWRYARNAMGSRGNRCKYSRPTHQIIY